MNTQHKPGRPFKQWSPEEHQTWQQLAERQLQHCRKKLSNVFFDGVEELQLATQRFPDLEQASRRLEARTGWQLTSTNLEFADGQTWFELLAQNQFLVTEYIRPLSSLEYTPKPDVFHDLFGHVPFLVDEQLSRIIRRFAQLILASSGETRKKLGHLWWYTIEFGLVKEAGELRAFGAGLASSFAELSRVFERNTALEPFDVETVSRTAESATAFHLKLFVLDSLDQLEEVLSNWSDERQNKVQ